ncbi:MerR family transcriptional regulator [Propionivibrio sp.]|uniref:MerR family transcriptional regulator n=1 Tax=Propionivibrio sp. TaxID=2212460 RepID=UPI003BF3BF89
MISRPSMTIAAVERDTGLGKDTLRVWERRYGYPLPTRDERGERHYPAEQVDRLRIIKRLMDQGHRPGSLFAASEEDLLLLAGSSQSPESAAPQDEQSVVGQILALIKAHDAQGLRQALNQAMMRQGLQRFVIDIVAPLNQIVGAAWMRGELEVFEEHLYSEQIKSLLRQAISSLPASTSGRPRILLTTVPEERHVLGLLMVEGLLTLDGATCISLGVQTPLFDIRAAAEAHRADIVALSFSSAFPARQIAPQISQLREMLSPDVELWVGGAGSNRLPAIDGVVVLPTLEAALAALRATQDGALEGH